LKVITPTYEILQCPDGEEALKLIEEIGRDCYQSHDKTTEDSHKKFVRRMVDNSHHAMIEFGGDIIVKFTSSRGFSHQIVRHRLCSFAQESLRYVNPTKEKHGGEITTIGISAAELCPKGDIETKGEALEIFFDSTERAEKDYKKLIAMGVPNQIAREVLPIGIRAIINVKGNLREWCHIFSLRCSKKASPRMRELMIPLLHELNKRIPIIFEDLAERYKEECLETSK